MSKAVSIKSFGLGVSEQRKKLALDQIVVPDMATLLISENQIFGFRKS